MKVAGRNVCGQCFGGGGSGFEFPAQGPTALTLISYFPPDIPGIICYIRPRPLPSTSHQIIPDSDRKGGTVQIFGNDVNKSKFYSERN